jgi:DNA-binding CsgD family transcriptional regulator
LTGSRHGGPVEGRPEGRQEDSWIETWRDATVLLDGEGKLLHANVLARDILDRRDGLAVLGGRLSSRDPDVAQRLRRATVEAANCPEAVRGDSVVIARPGGRRPYLVTIVPARRNEATLFPEQIRAIVTISDLDRRPRPDHEILQTAFGLSRAQTNVAALLASGQAGIEIAETPGISQFTVRRHLADILDRTGPNGRPTWSGFCRGSRTSSIVTANCCIRASSP